MVPNRKSRFRRLQVGLGWALMWWQSWVGRFAIHLPWILCALAYFLFLTGEQGQTALEYPVDRPLTAIFVVSTLAGMCAGVTWLLSRGHQAATLVPSPPLVTLADVRCSLRKSNAPGLREVGGPRRPFH